MEWNKVNTEKLVQLYEKETTLWDVKSAERKDSQTRLNALNMIANVFGIDIAIIEKKI